MNLLIDANKPGFQSRVRYILSMVLRGQTLYSRRAFIACTISARTKYGLEQFTAATGTATIAVVMGIN